MYIYPIIIAPWCPHCPIHPFWAVALQLLQALNNAFDKWHNKGLRGARGRFDQEVWSRSARIIHQ